MVFLMLAAPVGLGLFLWLIGKAIWTVIYYTIFYDPEKARSSKEGNAYGKTKAAKG